MTNSNYDQTVNLGPRTGKEETQHFMANMIYGQSWEKIRMPIIITGNSKNVNAITSAYFNVNGKFGRLNHYRVSLNTKCPIGMAKICN